MKNKFIFFSLVICIFSEGKKKWIPQPRKIKKDLIFYDVNSKSFCDVSHMSAKMSYKEALILS